MIDFSREIGAVERAEVLVPRGKVLQVVGMVVEASGPTVPVGDICLVYPDTGPEMGRRHAVPCEVVGFRDGRILMMPYGEMRGIHPGSKVVATRSQAVGTVGESLLGRVIDGAGHPLDGKPPQRRLAG